MESPNQGKKMKTPRLKFEEAMRKLENWRDRELRRAKDVFERETIPAKKRHGKKIQFIRTKFDFESSAIVDKFLKKLLTEENR